MIELLAALLVGLGLAIVVVGILLRARAREDELLALLELPYAEEDVDLDEVAQRVGLLEPGANAMDQVLERLDATDAIAAKLERARVPLRPGEFVFMTAIVTAGVALWAGAIVGQLFFALVGLVVVPLLAVQLVDRRIRKRQAAFTEQLPGALSLIASSLRAGNSFLRAIQAMVDQSPPPMSEEFSRVVAETQLGSPLVDALERMALRVQVDDFDWVVQAIRIQQQTGGKLADLLFTLSDYMRAREDVRREVQVLTAEGRFSAWILAALPLVVGLMVQASNPDYIAELFSGTGLVLLLGATVSVVIGLNMILRMVKKVEL